MLEFLTHPAGLMAVLFGVALVALGVLSLGLNTQLRELRRRDEVLATELKSSIGRLEESQTVVQALKGRQLELERKLDELRGRHDRLELRGPEGHPYAQAIALVKRGADTRELVSSFGLSPGEAELLRRMHALQEAS